MTVEREKHQIEDKEKTATEAFHAEKHKVILLEGQIKILAVEKEHHATKMSELYYNNKDNTAKTINLESENKSLNSRITDLSKQIVTDTLNNKKTMEKAITGSVKLCVVAPTVNVHVANKKLKFKSGMSQQALQDFLNAEILEQMQVSIEQHVNSAMDGTNGS